jgi:hypothetical protein
MPAIDYGKHGLIACVKVVLLVKSFVVGVDKSDILCNFASMTNKYVQHEESVLIFG